MKLQKNLQAWLRPHKFPRVNTRGPIEAKNVDASKNCEYIKDIGKRLGQDAVIVSERVDAFHPNARPEVEIGLLKPRSICEAEPLMETLRYAGMNGLTFATGRQCKVFGIREQFIPEYMGIKHAKAVSKSAAPWVDTANSVLDKRVLDMAYCKTLRFF